MAGYIKMARYKDNLAGIASMASYPIVEKEGAKQDEPKSETSSGNAYCSYIWKKFI